jgi:predicted acetyltransferase
MVHPKEFRKGIAKELLQFVEKGNIGYGKMIVSTGSKNIPAIKL